MTAGAEVVCNDVVRKVEIEEKRVAPVDGNVGGNGNGCVGGDGKDDADDSSYVFVSDGIEVSAGDSDDTGGGNVDDFASKSNSADGVDQLKKEEFGMENAGMPVDQLASETKGIFHESSMVIDSEVKAVKDDVNLENGSSVDPLVVVETNAIAQDVNGHLDKISGEEEAVVKSIEEVDDVNGISNVETKIDNIGSGGTLDPESTPNTIESSVTVTESDSTIHPSDVTITRSLSTADVINTTDESFSTPYTVSNTSCEVMVDDEPESITNLIDKEECQVTVDGSGKPSEAMECQVTADGSESSGSPTEEREGQVTGDESSKPCENLASQVTADEPKPFGTPNKQQECEASVDGSDSIGSLVDNQECSVSVESEPSGNHTEEVDGKSKDHQELPVVTSEINVEAEPRYVCSGIKAEHESVSVSGPCQFENKNAEGKDIGVSTESEENPDSGLVLSEDTDAPANGQAEKFDGILEMGESQISRTEADGSVLLIVDDKKANSEEKLEKQMEGSSETVPEVTESVEIEANSEDNKEHIKVEDGIRESQIVATDIVEDDLNLEDNTTESANEAEVPLETETNNESIIHVSTASQYEFSNSIDKPQVGFRLEGSSENIKTVDLVISECTNTELLAVTDNDLLSTHDESIVVEHVKVDEIRESQIMATEVIEDDLNLEDITTESSNEAEAPLETEKKSEPVIHVNTASQYEVSNSIDKPQEGFRPEGGYGTIETDDPVISECNNSELLVVKDNDLLSTHDDSMVAEHVNVEDEIQESQIMATDIVKDDLNLEDNTTESSNEVEAPLETETNIEPIIHVNTASQYEVSNSIDGTIETDDPVISECNNSELLVVKDNDLLSTHDDSMVVEHVNVEDEIQESQIMATYIVKDDLNLEDNATESSNEVEAPLEPETNIEPIIHINTASQYEVNNSIDKPQEGFQPEGSSENIETVDPVISECNNSELVVVNDSDSLSTPDELIAVEQKAEIVATLGTENGAAEDIDCGSGIENLDVSDDDDEKGDEVKDVPVEYVAQLVTKNRAPEGMDCGTGVENVDVSDGEEKGAEVKDAPVESVPHPVIENISAEIMDCGTGVKNMDFPDEEEKETEVKDGPIGGHSTLSFSDTIVNSGAVIEFGSIGRHETTHNIHNEEAEDIDGIQSDEVPTSSVEGSVIDAIDVQNEVVDILPYNFLIKIPRCEDENLKDQIRSAQLLVEEKTRLRDAIRVEIQGKREKLKAHNEAYNAAKTEETAARRLVRLKRQEIDSVQVVINRWKNAMSVEDIDGRIFNMEHMIQHETLLLKDEKQFIREIKQLKTLRDQLASNMGSPEEIRQAIDQKDHNEEHMKTLRKELEALKDKASKAEAVVKTLGKTYNEESRRERELQVQFRAADDVRQNVYANLNSLKKLSYDKNKNFRQFKEDLTAARDFASHGNKDALYRFCANQVETFMEQWNNNDEFRKEYISRCNMNASRRQRALDGGPLVPGDVAPVLPSNVSAKIDDGPVSIPGDVKTVSVVLPVEEEKIVSSTKKHTDNNRSTENVSGQKNQTLKTKVVAKSTGSRSDDVALVTELVVDNKKDENALTKEEIELAKKAEELKKEEIAAKLKEQRRLEEKAKAIEALERKKRNAEKAQIRAELRARKEAEQKEKEREKRLRKKEKKKTGCVDGSINGEEAAAAASSESANEAATKDTETVSREKNKKKTAAPPPHFLKQQQQLKPKPIPPPLVNRNRKRWQQWVKSALAVAAIFFLFLLGNTSYFRLKFSGLI